MSESRKVAAPETIAIAKVTEFADWVRLEERWNDLAKQSHCGPAFLSFGWFAAAWAWRKTDCDLLVLVAYAAERMVGALPLVRPRLSSPISRRLAGLTVPDTQHFDVVIAPETSEVVANAFARALMDQRDWDELQLAYLSKDGTIAREFLPALGRLGARTVSGAPSRNAYVPVDGTWTEYYATRSRSLKKANNLATNRLAKMGSIRIEHYAPGTTDASSRERVLAAAIDISAASWKRATGNSLDQPGPHAFIQTLTAAADQRGEVSIWVAYLDERPVAMEYQLVVGEDVYALRADFDANCVDISPGSYLFRHLLEHQFGRGMTHYYMGPGENPYKARWTDSSKPLTQLTVFNRTLRGTAQWQLLCYLKPHLRAWRDRLAQMRPTRNRPADGPCDAPGK